MATPEPAGGLLFDLDGTLIDTAPDMGGALNALLRRHGRDPLADATIRPHVSHGSKALVALGFGGALERDAEAALIAEYLDCYGDCVADGSRLFAGMAALLAELEQHGTPWGIVTNKPARYAVPLLAHLGLLSRCATLVCGDSLARRKPDPAPMLLACRRAALAPARCVYAGDARRDVAAGLAAGMRTVVMGWGYFGAEERPQDWGAQWQCEDAAALREVCREAGLLPGEA